MTYPSRLEAATYPLNPKPLPPCVRLRQVRSFVGDQGIENLSKRLINSREGKVQLPKPTMSLDVLMRYGRQLTQEQENVKRVQLAEEYMAGAALAGNNGR